MTSSVIRADSPTGQVIDRKTDYIAFLPTSLKAFMAANELLNEGVAIYRATSTGVFILPAVASITSALANEWALDVLPVEELPSDAVMMKKLRIAVYGDEGVAIALKELGFEYDKVSIDELNAGVISGYDVFVNQSLRWNSLDSNGQTSFENWFGNNGDYVGLLSRGAMFSKDAGLIDFEYESNSDADAILKIIYPSTGGINAGFSGNDYAYVLGAMWFTNVPAEVTQSAFIADNDFVVAGFWPEWPTSGANSQPVIIKKENDLQDTTLIAIDSTFRGHPKNTFRLLGNALFSGLE
jgi:hypothetical protein